MGNSASSNTVKSLNETIMNISSNSVQNCVVTVKQTQVVSQSMFGINIGTKQEVVQNTTVTNDCLQDVQRNNDLQAQITNALTQYAESELGAGAVGMVDSANEVVIGNKVKASLSVNNIQRNYNEIMQEQIVSQKMGGITIFGSQKAIQGAEVYAKAVQRSLEQNKVVTDIVNDVRQTSVSKVEGIFDALAANVTWIVIGVVIITLAALYVVYKNPQLVVAVLDALGLSTTRAYFTPASTGTQPQNPQRPQAASRPAQRPATPQRPQTAPLAPPRPLPATPQTLPTAPQPLPSAPPQSVVLPSAPPQSVVLPSAPPPLPPRTKSGEIAVPL